MPLISKPMNQFTPEEYHAYVSGMYELRTKKTSAKPSSGVSGLNVSRTKKSGALSIRRTKVRAFNYVTMAEIQKLANHAKCSQADLWNLFKKKDYIIAVSRMEAEQIYARIKEIPWDLES